MTVYLSSVDQELLYAIRAIEVLLESGVGVAEAMKHVADEDYGDLSGGGFVISTPDGAQPSPCGSGFRMIPK